MIDSIMQFISPVISFLEAKYGVIGSAVGYLVMFGLPLLSLLFQIVDFAFAVLDPKDESKVAALEASWENKIRPVLAVLPHANVPLSAIMQAILSYATRGFAAVKGALTGWGSGNPPAPPAPPAA